MPAGANRSSSVPGRAERVTLSSTTSRRPARERRPRQRNRSQVAADAVPVTAARRNARAAILRVVTVFASPAFAGVAATGRSAGIPVCYGPLKCISGQWPLQHDRGGPWYSASDAHGIAVQLAPAGSATVIRWPLFRRFLVSLLPRGLSPEVFEAVRAASNMLLLKTSIPQRARLRTCRAV